MRTQASSTQRMALAALLTVMIVGALVLVLVLVTGGRPGADVQATPASPTVAQTTAAPSSTAPPTSATPSAAPIQTPSATEQTTTDTAPENSATAPASGPRSSTPGCDGTPLVAPSDPDLANTLAQTAANWGASFEAAWYDPEKGIVQAGGLSNLAAWSTSKVPLSVAIVQSGQGDAYAGTISSAIRVSDNAAAQALWQAVGPDDVSRAATVTGVLQQAGDNVTQVPSTQLLPPYTIFGQTQWSTAAQVTFMQQLPCLNGSGQVINEMAQISPQHSWGLGRLPGAVFKGGWGPDGGGYLVRQMGWYTTADGQRVLIAIAVHAGSFDAGVGVLDAMAASLG